MRLPQIGYEDRAWFAAYAESEGSEQLRAELRDRVRAFIEGSAHQGGHTEDFDSLALDLARWQYYTVEAFRRYVNAQHESSRHTSSQHTSSQRTDLWSLNSASALPGLPTDVYRHARVAAHSPVLDARVFLTSGTTSGDVSGRGQHAFRSLGLYDLAARRAAEIALFSRERLRGHMPLLVFITPLEQEMPESSLSYMLTRFASWFGTGGVALAGRRDGVDLHTLCTALTDASRLNQPVALFGTSFAFVHAEDALGDTRFELPPQSFLMQTGGFKGRTREVAPDQMRAMLRQRYGLDDANIVAEYGMTEMSSQCYERVDAGSASGSPPAYWVPPWVRAVPVSPTTLEPVALGEVGILKLIDLANLDSAAVIQTADRARWTERGLELLGRAKNATPRGCSLSIESRHA